MWVIQSLPLRPGRATLLFTEKQGFRMRWSFFKALRCQFRKKSALNTFCSFDILLFSSKEVDSAEYGHRMGCLYSVEGPSFKLLVVILPTSSFCPPTLGMVTVPCSYISVSPQCCSSGISNSPLPGWLFFILNSLPFCFCLYVSNNFLFILIQVWVWFS